MESAMWLPLAIVGSSLLGAGASAAAGSAAASQQKKAADQANATQLSMFREANQLNEPWRMAGINALAAQQALLGIGGGSGAASPYAAVPGSPDWTAYLQANPDVAASYQQAVQNPHLRNQGIQSLEDYARYHYETHGRGEGRQLPTVAGPTGADGQPLTQQQITDQAYQNFLGSGFNRAATDFTAADLEKLRGNYGAGGALLSGSAVGAMGDRLARNRYMAFGDHYNALSGLSGTGAQLSTAQGQQGLQVAQAIGQNNMGAAAARGSSYMNTAKAINAGLQNTTNVLAYGYGEGWFGNSSRAAGTTDASNVAGPARGSSGHTGISQFWKR